MKDFTRAYRDAEVELADIERMSSLFPGLLALPDRRDSSPELSRPRYEEVINHEQSPSSSASGSSGHCSSPLPYDARPPSCPHSRYNSVFEDALPIPFSDPMMNYNPVGRDFLEFIPRRPALSMLVTESEGEFDAEWRDELGAWRVDSTLDLQPVIVEGLIGLGLGGI